MSWIEHHKSSERLAAQAQFAVRQGRREEARELYVSAANAEERALENMDRSKVRTLGISVVSAVSLHCKANQFARAETVAARWLGSDALPAFAGDQLRLLLQSIWSEQVRDNAGARFAPGEVLFSVQGGEVVSGGAPLDLIADKVTTVQSIFHRTAEFMRGLEHRRHGAPSRDIQESCRLWLFQTVPGRYQFAVAVQEERQPDLSESPSPGEVADCFLRILRVGIEDPEGSFAEVVPPLDYRRTFLKLIRHLAPDGKSCNRLDIRSPAEAQAISLDSEVRRNLGSIIRKAGQGTEEPTARQESLHGILRALHRDWIELAIGNESVRVASVGEEAEDVLGPLINKPVIVHMSVVEEKRKFLDIELDSQPIGRDVDSTIS